jgi:hypothetical protein
MDWERLGNNGMKAGGCIFVVMPGAGLPIIVASLIIREIARLYHALKQNPSAPRNRVTSFSYYRFSRRTPRSSTIEQPRLCRRRLFEGVPR